MSEYYGLNSKNSRKKQLYDSDNIFYTDLLFGIPVAIGFSLSIVSGINAYQENKNNYPQQEMIQTTPNNQTLDFFILDNQLNENILMCKK